MNAIFLSKAIGAAIFAVGSTNNTPVELSKAIQPPVSVATSAKAVTQTPVSQDSPPPVQEPTAPQPKNPNYFDPQMAILGVFRGTISDNSGEKKLFDFSEIEFNFVADVDPYSRAYLVIAVVNEDGETITELEEATITYSNFGRGLQAKAGKFAGAIGRIQRNHLDQLEFNDYPFVIQDVLGEEGLRAPGASFSYLFPGDRFNELSLEAVNLPEDGPLFMNSSISRPVFIGRYRTFFDFSEDVSAQLGASYATGPNGDTSGNASLFGVDFTTKWNPSTKGKSAIFEAEAYWANPEISGTGTTFGAFAALTYEVMPRWFATLKADYSEIPGTADIRKATSFGVTYKLSEFQLWRLEYQQILSNFESTRNALTLKLQWLIGTHPAHKY